MSTSKRNQRQLISCLKLHERIAHLVGHKKQVLLVGKSTHSLQAVLQGKSQSIYLGFPELRSKSSADGPFCRWRIADTANRSLTQFPKCNVVVVGADDSEVGSNLQDLLAELAKHLDASGFVFVLAPNIDSLEVRLPLLAGGPTQPGLNQKRLFTSSSIREVLSKAKWEMGNLERVDYTSQEIAKLKEAFSSESRLIEDLLTHPECRTRDFLVVAYPTGALNAAALRFRLESLASSYEKLQREFAEWKSSQQMDSRKHAALHEQLEMLSDSVNTLFSLQLESQDPLKPQDHVLLTQLEEQLRGLGGNAHASTTGEICSTYGYRSLVHRIRGTVEACTALDSAILVISKGDDDLISFEGRIGGHFPSNHEGVYSGHHPADSDEAVAILKKQIELGAKYLLIPSTSAWWLDHYLDFCEYLDSHHTRILDREGICVLYELANGAEA